MLHDHLKVGDPCHLKGGDILRCTGVADRARGTVGFVSPCEPVCEPVCEPRASRHFACAGAVVRILTFERDGAMLELRILEAAVDGREGEVEALRVALRELRGKNDTVDVEIRNARLRMGV